MTEGRLLEWLVQPGDAVHRGDLVAVVKTDKADVEVEIFDDGVIGELLVPVGDEMLEIGTPLATVVDAGCTDDARRSHAAARGSATPHHPNLRCRATATATAIRSARASAPAPAPRPHSCQRARPWSWRRPTPHRRAEELGVDLTRVTPSQPGHPIGAADVERAAAARPRGPAAPTPADQADAMRLAIGRLMARSKREIPHYYLADDIELTAALAWLEHRNESAPVAERILPAALLYKAVALAAAARPELNGFWVDDRFVPGSGVHLGVAISLRGGGLVAPAVHDADKLSLEALMAALRDLTTRARGRAAARLRDDRRDDHRHQPRRPRRAARCSA